MDEPTAELPTRHALDQLAGGQRPESAATSLIDMNVAIPVNAALAANVLANGRYAGPVGAKDETDQLGGTR